MKKMMIALVAMLLTAATGKAMSYEQARNEALFLTDKMAYELNLSQEQYEAAYEINLDYLMGVTSYDDVYGVYWERRNMDLGYILLDWQLRAFRAATYFYRPLYWRDGFWHFGVYARYPRRDYFYFGRPAFYATYRGGHAWHVNGNRSWYHTRRDHILPPPGRNNHYGMRDGWDRGDFRGNHHHSGRSSSTRTTVNNQHWNRGNNGIPNNSGIPNNNGRNGNRSLGGYRGNSGNSTPNSSSTLGGNRNSGSSVNGSSTRGSSLGRSTSSHSSGSLGGGHSTGGGTGGGRSTGGGHSYGGRR